ncbi:MAG: hypothetical protein CML02_15325 [Pseudooceanicola sp.]|jgi:hypothetical protein|nr:hypothetical protein [Pseudooceanicola sp.]
MSKPRIVLHLKAAHLSRDFSVPFLRLYGVIEDLAQAHGITVERRQRDGDIRVGTHAVSYGRFDDGNLHIIDDRSVVADNVLNAGLAYFRGYWHLDPRGTRYRSGIAGMVYDESAVRYRPARDLFQRLRQQYVMPRKSRYPQPEQVELIEPGVISVFFQGRYPIDSGATEFDDFAMLRAVLAGAGGRRVVVKPHPNASTSDDLAQLDDLAQSHPDLLITNANVHDILSAACATVSINSTVALEGYLHRTPAVLFGASDFHHIAETVTDATAFARALARAIKRRGGYAQYLAWYFRDNCLSPDAPDCAARIWDRFAAAGYPADRFGS